MPRFITQQMFFLLDSLLDRIFSYYLSRNYKDKNRKITNLQMTNFFNATHNLLTILLLKQTI